MACGHATDVLHLLGLRLLPLRRLGALGLASCGLAARLGQLRLDIGRLDVAGLLRLGVTAVQLVLGAFGAVPSGLSVLEPRAPGGVDFRP